MSVHANDNDSIAPTPQPLPQEERDTLVASPTSGVFHVTLVPDDPDVIEAEQEVIEAAAKPFRYDRLSWIRELEWIVLYGRDNNEIYFVPVMFSRTKAHGNATVHMDLLDQFHACRDLTNARPFTGDNTHGRRFWRVSVGITEVHSYDQDGNSRMVYVGGRCCRELLPLLGCLFNHLRVHPNGPSFTIEITRPPTETATGTASVHLYHVPVTP